MMNTSLYVSIWSWAFHWAGQHASEIADEDNVHIVKCLGLDSMLHGNNIAVSAGDVLMCLLSLINKVQNWCADM